jgi:O-antigen ligase
LTEIALVAAWFRAGLGHLFSHKKIASAKAALHSTRFGWLDGTILLYLMVNVISVIWAVDKRYYTRGIVPILENIAFYYLLVFFSRTVRHLKLALKFFLALGVVALILSALYYFWRMEFLEVVPTQDLLVIVSNKTRLGSPSWGGSNYYASLMLLFVPTYLSLAILGKSLKNRIFFSIISGISLLEFYFTFSRGGYIALLCALILGVIILLKQRKISPRLLATVFLASVVIIVAMYYIYAHFAGIDSAVAEIENRVFTLDDQNAKIRMAFIQAALQSISNSILGLGVGNYLVHPGLENVGVHNAYLQIALETGWIGILVALAMFALLLRSNLLLFKNLKGTRYEPYAIGLFLSFIAILINILGEATFEGIIFGWVFWLMQGIVRVLSERRLVELPISRNSNQLSRN